MCEKKSFGFEISFKTFYLLIHGVVAHSSDCNAALRTSAVATMTTAPAAQPKDDGNSDKVLVLSS